MNVMVTQGAEGLPRRAFTVDDAFRMVETGIISPDERLELIEGEFVPMNAKNNHHQRVQNRLTKLLIRLVPDDLDVGIEPTLQLSETTYVEPDFVIYRDTDAKRLGPDRALLVIEVSDSSLGFDLGRKAALMAKAGITDFWVIDAQKLETTVHRDPGVDRYRSVETLTAASLLVPLATELAAVRFKLADLA
ncbi:Uma2 family endonuclease [Phreatobacter stygius]|uniref:Uma2 family endonuclease n=1 Tax=Phreatobacter stygius TaxID=1940610 RepID=A0A4D7B7X3_9HYPH|nr:Uma2 family endonuclease [Phreatobacter stygius]QCI66418.1 Uma2 family endonuclease [Phreatobacter stygius]